MRGLAAYGICPGMRTVLMVKPCLDFFALTFALFKLGATPVLIDPGMGIKNLGRCLAEAEPEAFIGIPKAHVARRLFGWARSTIRINITVGPRFSLTMTTLRQVRRAAEAAPASGASGGTSGGGAMSRRTMTRRRSFLQAVARAHPKVLYTHMRTSTLRSEHSKSFTLLSRAKLICVRSHCLHFMRPHWE